LIHSVENGDLVNYKPFVASTIWFSGCNTSCSYCHNKELLTPILRGSVSGFLSTIPDSISHVVLSGGEPTSSAQFIYTLKSLVHQGKWIRLYTNGLNADFPYLGSISSIVVTPPEVVFNCDAMMELWVDNVERIYNNVSDVLIRIPKLDGSIFKINEVFPKALVDIFDVEV
jgi:organic radical activating enzyme